MAAKIWDIDGFVWYPKSNFKNYAYSKLLETEKGEQAAKTLSSAQNVLSNALTSINSSSKTYTRSYNALGALYKSERQVEEAFIRTYAKISADVKLEMVDIIKAMNEIFQNKNLYDEALRNLKSLEEKNGKWTGEVSEIYSLLKWVIPEAINEAAKEFLEVYDLQKSDEKNVRILEDKIILKVTEVLQKEIEKINSEDSSVNSNTFELIQNLDSSQRDRFVRDILEAYGLSTKALLNDFNKSINKNTKRRTFNKDKFQKSIHSAANSGQGNAFEQLASLALQEIQNGFNSGGNGTVKFTAHQTGQMGNMKADQLIYIGDVEVDLEQMEKIFEEAAGGVRDEGTRSRRLQNITGLEEMTKNIDQAVKAIVEISDKSYKLTGEAFAQNARYGRGFAAETPDLNSLQATLSRTNLSSNLDNLIFVLKNSGEEMINGNNTDSACKIIALNIGTFLFDDINVTDALDDQRQSLSRIHLFNLGGIMMPLSVFLEAAYNAFSNNQQRLTDYIDVTFHIHRAEPNTDGNSKLEKKDWEYFNQEKMKSKVAIHFFGDFINFVKQYL